MIVRVISPILINVLNCQLAREIGNLEDMESPRHSLKTQVW